MKKVQAGWLRFTVTISLVVGCFNSSAWADEPPPPVDLTQCPDWEENGRMVMEGQGCFRTLPWQPTIQVEFDRGSVGRITGSLGSTEIYLEKGKIRVSSLLVKGKGASIKVRVLGDEETVAVEPGVVAQVEFLQASEEVACIATKGVMKVTTSYSSEKPYQEGEGEVFPLRRPVAVQASDTSCSLHRPRRKNRRTPEVWGFAGLLGLVLLRRLCRKY